MRVTAVSIVGNYREPGIGLLQQIVNLLSAI